MQTYYEDRLAYHFCREEDFVTDDFGNAVEIKHCDQWAFLRSEQSH